MPQWKLAFSYPVLLAVLNSTPALAQGGTGSAGQAGILGPADFPLTMKALALSDSGKKEDACKLLEEASRDPNVNSKVLLMFAQNWHYNEGAAGLAIRLYRTVLARGEHGEGVVVFRPEVLGHLGLALNAEKRYQETLVELAVPAKAGIDSPSVYAALASAYRALGEEDDLGQAAAVLALLMNPANQDSWSGLPAADRVAAAGKARAIGLLPAGQEDLFSEVVSRGQPGSWSLESLPQTAAVYRRLIDLHERRGFTAAARSVRTAFALGAWNGLRNLMQHQQPEEMLDLLSLCQRMFPVSEMPPPLRKSFYFHLATAYLWLDEPLQAVRAVEELAKSPEELLLTFEDDGKIHSHLVLKYLQEALSTAWTSISWDLETGQLRERDPRDFAGHFFRIGVDPDQVDPRSVLTVDLKASKVDPETGIETFDEKGKIAMIPYGMVSRSEDWATIRVCRHVTEHPNGAESFFCGGMRVFPSFLNGGPPMPKDPSYEALLAWSLEQHNFELPIKDLIMVLMDTFDQKIFLRNVREAVPSARIEAMEAALQSSNSEDISATTGEAFEIAKRAHQILVEIQEKKK